MTLQVAFLVGFLTLPVGCLLALGLDWLIRRALKWWKNPSVTRRGVPIHHCPNCWCAPKE